MRSARGGAKHSRRQGLGGFTLAEALLASMVLAIISASAVLPVLAATQQSQHADRLRSAVALGQALLDEIAARPVVSSLVADAIPGPSGAETSRKLFRNVDAFHGLAESDGVLRDFEGQPITDAALAGLWRSVSVQYVTYPGQMAGDTTSLALVQVRVYDGTSLVVTLSRLLAAEG